MNGKLIHAYEDIVGKEEIMFLKQLASRLSGLKIVHVNSTREGGGVAEILNRLVPLQRELGIDSSWEVITGGADFFAATKTIHNTIQGSAFAFTQQMKKSYESTNMINAERLREKLEAADCVFIHDPQPAPLLSLCPARKGKWVWRCHIDVSAPMRGVWNYLKQWIAGYDASIFSLPDYVQDLPHPKYLIQPTIDPLSEKNIDLPEQEIEATFKRFGLDKNRPMIIQVSRFDRFKDPVGVVKAYRIVKKHMDIQLVLAGGSASDDPEGEEVFNEVMRAAENDPDIHVLILPSDAHRTINALQRAADIILQKSVKEGFGLTVTEGMWKRKPVIGGNVGGIRLQLVERYTGFRVNTNEGAAYKIRYLLQHREEMKKIGEQAHDYVRENFLITRLLRNHMALILDLIQGAEGERLEVRA